MSICLLFYGQYLVNCVVLLRFLSLKVIHNLFLSCTDLTVSRFLQRENIPAKDKYQNHPPAYPDQGGAQFLSLKESAELLQKQFRKRKVSGTHLPFTALFKHTEVKTIALFFQLSSIIADHNLVYMFTRHQ